MQIDNIDKPVFKKKKSILCHVKCCEENKVKKSRILRENREYIRPF